MIGIRKLVYVALLAILVATLAIPQVQADDYKITILQSYKLTELQAALLNTDTNTIEDFNATKAVLLDYGLRDPDTSDNYVPAIVINLSAASYDANTGEKIVYAWIFDSVAGTICLASLNGTTVENIIKITATGSDIMVYMTDYDIVIESTFAKFSINKTDQAVIFTDSELALNSVMYAELRALQDTPEGYTLLRSDSNEADFMIEAQGTLSIWFDESHDVGDVDLFIFDGSNPDYSQASLNQGWYWLATHADAYIFADAGPSTKTITATGDVRFIVKLFSGNTPSWRVAVRLTSEAPSTPTPASTPSQITPTPTPEEEGWIDQLQSVFEGSNTVIIAIAIVLFLVIVLIALRK